MSTRLSAFLSLSLVLSAAAAGDAAAQALWEDVTESTIGDTAEWSNKVELADINGDGLVDILFANGGDYHQPGTPESNRVFLNQGPGEAFVEATEDVLGPTPDLSRSLKVRDVNADGIADIVVSGSYESQTRLYLGQGEGRFEEVTDTHLPQMSSSAGDVELGDVDGDGDIDMVLAEWGPGDPCVTGALACPSSGSDSEGGRQILWLNDGTGTFEDATETAMPETKIQWSWDFELIDVDNDFDLDLAVSCKACPGSFLFHNDGSGVFTDRSELMPQFTNNYEFEPIDINGDGFLDLVTINDGDQVSEFNQFDKQEHVFLADGEGGFTDGTADVWPDDQNLGADDNAVVVLDFDSDGDPDFLIGSLDASDRLMVNNDGKLEMIVDVFDGADTPGTLGIAVADLDGDGRLDVVQSQGELADPEKVYFGTGLQVDSAAPVISLADRPVRNGSTLIVRARIHDNKTPVMPHDFTGAPVVELTAGDGEPRTVPMQWYGEALWRASIDDVPEEGVTYTICASDAQGNERCTDAISADSGGSDSADCAAGQTCEKPDESSGGCSTSSGTGSSVAALLLVALLFVRRR